MEIKVNDYVRTKKGYICKIININDFREPSIKYGVEASYLKDIMFIGDEDIIKSSPRIIDLIRVGDVLIIKDFVDEACMIFTDIYLIQNETQLLNIKSDLEKNKNKKLYSILTKEQFEQMEYKIN